MSSTEGDAPMFVSESGLCFHENDGCIQTTPDVVSLDEAIESGLTPCGRCVGHTFRYYYIETISE